MRSRRQSLSKMMRAKMLVRMVAMRKNMRAFTPPRNRMPMAMTAITIKAPKSGSPSSSAPTTPTAMAMGATAERKRSLTSILRTM